MNILILAPWPHIGLVWTVCFPKPFSASNVSYDPKTSTSYDSINAPKVRLVRGLKIAHLIVNRLVNKLDGVRVLMCLHEVKPGFPRTYLTVKSL